MSANKAQFRLPDVGEGLPEAEIVHWRVAVGDQVKLDDMVVEIETAKSLVELPCPFAGTVTALLAAEGDTVAVGTPIIEVETAGGDAAAGDEDEGGESGPNLVGYGPRAARRGRRARRQPAAEQPEPAPPAAEQPEPAAPEPATVRALAKPPVRKLAKDLGVDLSTVHATGPDGIATRSDVLAAADAGDAAGPSPTAAPLRTDRGETRVDVRGVRKVTADAMVASAFTAPHVTEWVEVDVTRSTELVARLRRDRRLRDVKVTPLLLVARAVCVALARTPELNSSWDADTGQIIRKHYVNLGIAADTPRGLVVPVIPDADQLGVRELAEAISELTTTARAGRTQPAQMTGGTFTITNVGVFGVDGGTPILNPGQAGILAVGAIHRRPWVIDEQVVPRDVTTLSVSFDHRVADGAEGSRFLADVAAILADPGATLVLL